MFQLKKFDKDSKDQPKERNEEFAPKDGNRRRKKSNFDKKKKFDDEDNDDEWQ